jgi:putative PIN family toxin of toxin-antitoxin system
MIRVVLDTNTIISGLFWRGTPRQIYVAGAQEKYHLLTSENLISELYVVLQRKKFAPLLTALGKTSDDLIAEFRRSAELVTPAEIPQDAVRDPKDRVVLACALGGQADCIVSGDEA